MIQQYFADYFSGYGDFAHEGFDCNVGPMWYAVLGGLPQRQTVIFDEQENPEALCTISPCPEADILFPIEAQRVSITDLDVTPDSGWLYANLNMPDVFTCNDGQDCTMMAQAWITAVHSAEGRFSAGSAGDPARQLLPTTEHHAGCRRSVRRTELVFNFFTDYVSTTTTTRTAPAGQPAAPAVQAPN